MTQEDTATAPPQSGRAASCGRRSWWTRSTSCERCSPPASSRRWSSASTVPSSRRTDWPTNCSRLANCPASGQMLAIGCVTCSTRSHSGCSRTRRAVSGVVRSTSRHPAHRPSCSRPRSSSSTIRQPYRAGSSAWSAMTSPKSAGAPTPSPPPRTRRDDGSPQSARSHRANRRSTPRRRRPTARWRSSSSTSTVSVT